MKRWAILDSEKRPFLILDSAEMAKAIIKECPDCRAEKIEVEENV